MLVQKTELKIELGNTFFFDADENSDSLSPYKYIKAFHTFQELLFIWISESPKILEGLRYDEQNLGRTRGNEEAVLLKGLDARVRFYLKIVRCQQDHH